MSLANAQNAYLQAGQLGAPYGLGASGSVHFQRTDGPGASVTISHQLTSLAAERLEKAIREILIEDAPLLQAEQRAAYNMAVAQQQQQAAGTFVGSSQ